MSTPQHPDQFSGLPALIWWSFLTWDRALERCGGGLYVLPYIEGVDGKRHVETSHLARYSDRRLAGIVTDHALAAADLIAEAAAAIAEQQRRGT